MENSRFDIISDLFKANLPAVAKRIVRIFAGTSDTA